MATPVERIRKRLEEALSPLHLEIVDASAAHVGHVEAGGGGHYFVTIVSEAFRGKPLLERHQMVYRALSEMMVSEIHALSIKAYTPEEFQTAGGGAERP